jgi:hypothetical protein
VYTITKADCTTGQGAKATIYKAFKSAKQFIYLQRREAARIQHRAETLDNGLTIPVWDSCPQFYLLNAPARVGRLSSRSTCTIQSIRLPTEVGH